MTINYDDLTLEELNYNSYLRLPELLNLQKQISSPPHHDEMFFIIIHQTAELWFKEVLHETTILVEAFRAGVVSKALKALKRISAIMELQIKQIRLLSTLTPVEFAGFRDLLRPASGFQSAQYRILEFTYGIRNPFFLKFFDQIPEVSERLHNIMKTPSIYDECLMCLSKLTDTIPEETYKRDYAGTRELNEGLIQAIKEIYERSDQYHWVLLFEALIDLDERLIIWRKTHATMVQRTIGDQQGTGGSAGFKFLSAREGLRAFPELWEVRNRIGGDY